jgi:hypothetical protein
MRDVPWRDFLAVAVPLGLALATLRRHTWRRWVRGLICASILVLFAFVYFDSVSAELGPPLPWYDNTPVREIILFVVMLLGTVARYITKAIEERRTKILALRETGKPFEKPGLEWDTWEFSYPLFVSIVTFGALLSQVKEPSLSLASIVLGFQTGFFWQTILASYPGQHER